MDQEPWQDLYRTLHTPPLPGVMTGLNVNLDRSIPVTPQVLDTILRRHRSIPGLLPRFWRSLRRCASDELFVEDRDFSAFSRHFTRTGTYAIGGQAGIAAVHLAAAGVPAVSCLAPALGDEARRALMDAGVTVIGPRPAEMIPDCIHLVFEHTPDLVLHDKGVEPRKARFIVSPRHPAGSVLLPDALLPEAEKAAAAATRIFLSGYQYLTTDAEFVVAARQIHRLREVPGDKRIHVEWVSADDPALIARLLRFILPAADSLGVNETELGYLSRGMDPAGYYVAGDAGDPENVQHQALDLAKTTGLRRLHVHTYGWYCLVLKNPTAPRESRAALLFASREAVKGVGTGHPDLVPEGMEALRTAEALFGPAREPGIFSAGDQYDVIVVPALVTKDIGRTAGMGDRISSMAFAADPF